MPARQGAARNLSMARTAKKPLPSGIDPDSPSDPVEIVSSDERWSQCTLKDGSIIRLRPVVVEVRRARNKFNPDGEPIYLLKTALITDTKSPPRLRKKTTTTAKRPRKKAAKRTVRKKA